MLTRRRVLLRLMHVRPQRIYAPPPYAVGLGIKQGSRTGQRSAEEAMAAAAAPGADAEQIQNAVTAQMTGYAGSDNGAKRRRTEGGHETVVGGAELSDVADTFRAHSVHQQAYGSYLSEILRHPLAWARRTGPGPEDYDWPALDVAKRSPEIPGWCRRFVYDAVESFLISGWFVWVASAKHDAAFIVPPELVELASSPAAPEWKIHPGSRATAMGWGRGKLKNLNLVLVSAPSSCGCRSGALRAAKDTARYNMLEENFDMRDRANSQPTIYTTVSKDLRNQHGSSRPWFRTANAGDVAGYRGSIDTDFNDLVARRADTIRKLADMTMHERERLSGGSGAGGPVGLKRALAESGDGDELGAKELMVTDGREYTQLHMLNSMTDGKNEKSDLYTAIMNAFEVPPQYRGKNVNTERHAASNRLTESAVDIFKHHCMLLRSQVSRALNEACAKPHGNFFVTFRPFVDKGDVERLAPILEPDFAAMVMAAAYGIPEKYIDRNALTASTRPAQQQQPASKAGAAQAKPGAAPGSEPGVPNKHDAPPPPPSATDQGARP